MAETLRGKTFIKGEPSLTTEEIVDARAMGKNALSFRGIPYPISEAEIGFVAVKFALADGTSPTILLDQFAGRVLWQLLQTLNELDWKPPAEPGRMN